MTRAVGTAAVIGAGPAGLMAAERLADGGARVTVYDRMPSVGRKLLMAGRGGLNLTHSEPLPRFVGRYRHDEPQLRAAIETFPPERLRAWCETLGQQTFVGSSGRVFPTAMKASPLLRAWLRRLAECGVTVALRHRWNGWSPGGVLRFATPEGAKDAPADVTVLALGGASWPQLGSDGAWSTILAGEGAGLAPLRPANCGMLVEWSPLFRDKFEGVPLKNVALRFLKHAARGDVTVTRHGLEGGAVYALSGVLREALDIACPLPITVDLRPDVALADLAGRLAVRGKGASLSTTLRKRLHLAPAAIGLLQEAAHSKGIVLGELTPEQLAALVRAVPVALSGTAPMARAISTAGGLRFEALDPAFMLRGRPGVFAAGEMLDWEAPTGGYLLQGCFATGAAAGSGALAWLRQRPGAGEPAADQAVRRSSTTTVSTMLESS